jgi:2-polyprenyl-3-methyl-5-hydroxy-6-metoxy-1,4-benzoquinol methylase
MTRTLAAAACRLCGSEQASQLSAVLRDGMEREVAQRPYRCASCDFVFLHPAMTDGEATAFYEGAFRRRYHGEGYDLHAFHEGRRDEAHRRRCALRAEGLLSGRALEVGCATGAFLQAVAPEVASCRGVEPDTAQREFARSRGLRVASDLGELGSSAFDLVAAFHVLEHVSDPVGFLADLGDRLAPDGALVVEVPNVDDALLTLYPTPEAVRFAFHPAHQSYFSAATLEAAARRAGLLPRVVGLQRYGLGNHLHWLARREPGGQGWLHDVISAETERSFTGDLVTAMACDTLWMVARRAP